MSTAITSAVIQPLINEHARVVLALPKDTTFYSEARFVPIVWEGVGNEPTPQPLILDSEEGSLPYLPRWRLIDYLCLHRAMQTVDGRLQVQRKVVTPERYLGLWRTALEQPITAETLARDYGSCIQITLGAPLDKMRGKRNSWTSSPFQVFEEFEAAYGHRFVLGASATGEPCFQLTLDLREPEAARHSFYAETMLAGMDGALVRATITPATAMDAQPFPENQGEQTCLFEGVAA
jgi:hypothetical protein